MALTQTGTRDIEVSNGAEYEMIRNEMQQLKDSITNYFGFVLGGFGASIIGVSLLGGEKLPSHASGLALTGLILAATVSLILRVLFYKFYSHNRYAGYCKLLNQG